MMTKALNWNEVGSLILNSTNVVNVVKLFC